MLNAIPIRNNFIYDQLLYKKNQKCINEPNYAAACKQGLLALAINLQKL